MEDIIKAWQSIPEEARGALLMWLSGVALAGFRWLAAKVPAGPMRSTLDAVDLLFHAATASSKKLADRTAPAPKRPSVP